MSINKTFIQGKDAALEDSIEHFQTKLTALGFDIEEASWLNPVPNVWSVHIRDKACSLCFTNGKGATQKAALASALGEYFERLSTNYFFADFYLGEQIAKADFVHYPNEKWFTIPEDDSLPNGMLDDYLNAHYDPDNELFTSGLIDLQSSNSQRGMCTLPYVRQRDQQTVYIPMNIIANLYVSNGMSAGNTVTEARVQGLSEVFERFVKNKVIAERISLPEIPNSVLARYPSIQASIAKLEEEGFGIYCFDASLGGQYPVIAVVLLNSTNGSCFASFGAHPNFEVALERSVTELLQGRSLKELDVFSPPTFDDEEVADHANLETHFIDSSGVISWDLFKTESDYEFIDWSFAGSTSDELSTLLAIIHDQDYEVYIMDYEHLGVYACRILVPGMSEVYPVEDLLYANNTMGIHLRDTVLSLPDMDLAPADYLALLEQMDEEGLDEATRVREFFGIATGNNNAWYTLRIGELKSMLALAGGDLEQALAWVEWTRDFNQSTFSDERNNYYRCLHTLLLLNEEADRDLDNYETVFKRMYGESTYQSALLAIEGKSPFYGLFTIHADFAELPAHQALLAAYQKLQIAKSKHVIPKIFQDAANKAVV